MKDKKGYNYDFESSAVRYPCYSMKRGYEKNELQMYKDNNLMIAFELESCPIDLDVYENYVNFLDLFKSRPLEVFASECEKQGFVVVR